MVNAIIYFVFMIMVSVLLNYYWIVTSVAIILTTGALITLFVVITSFYDE